MSASGERQGKEERGEEIRSDRSRTTEANGIVASASTEPAAAAAAAACRCQRRCAGEQMEPRGTTKESARGGTSKNRRLRQKRSAAATCAAGPARCTSWSSSVEIMLPLASITATCACTEGVRALARQTSAWAMAHAVPARRNQTASKQPGAARTDSTRQNTPGARMHACEGA